MMSITLQQREANHEDQITLFVSETRYAPYDDISQYLTLVKNSPKNWELALLDHIDNIDEKREFAKTTPYEFSITQDINLNVDNILGLYRQIAQDTGVELKN